MKARRESWLRDETLAAARRQGVPARLEGAEYLYIWSGPGTPYRVRQRADGSRAVVVV